MHEGERFSAKTLGTSVFHFQSDWSGYETAGQFGQMESAHIYNSIEVFS